jgi:hypothetical protein
VKGTMAIAGLVRQAERLVRDSGGSEGFDAARWVAAWLNQPLPALGGKRPSEFMIANLLAQQKSGAYAQGWGARSGGGPPVSPRHPDAGGLIAKKIAAGTTTPGLCSEETEALGELSILISAQSHQILRMRGRRSVQHAGAAKGVDHAAAAQK